MKNITADWLQSIEALKDVPHVQLQWLIDDSRHYSLSEGEYLFKNRASNNRYSFYHRWQNKALLYMVKQTKTKYGSK